MDTIYLDNAATSYPKAPHVGQAMAHYIEQIGANINRSTYERATDAAMCVLDTRELLRDFFHLPAPANHVVFTCGATAALNQILRGYLHAGDHVIVSSMEHNAVMRPIIDLTEMGVTFSRIPADQYGVTKAQDLMPLIKDNTKLVIVSHASNVSGTLFPLEEVAEICHACGIPLAVDAAQTAGHIAIDFEKLHLSALSVPGHKGLLGPQGIGALLLDEKFAKALTPIFSGGTGSASDSEIQPPYMPDKFESGTQNIPGIFGFYAALQFIKERGLTALHAHEMELTKQFLDGLKELPVRLAGTADLTRRVGVISLDFAPLDNAEVAYRLESEFGILTRCGLHCAPNAHKTLGTYPQGTVRFSIGFATTREDIERALHAIRQITA